MNRTSNVVSSSLTLALLTVMSLAVGACGRKGGLDLPPSATAAPAGGALATESEPKDAAAVQGNLYNSGNPADRSQYAPKGPKKRIILDPILD